MRINIAMVAACPFPAAFASSGLIREMSLALCKRGHRVHVVTYHLGVNDFNVDGLTIHRIPHIPFYRKVCSGISIGKPFLDIFLLWKLMSVVKRFDIDVIHAHNYEAPIAGYLTRALYDIPVVYHAHNTMFHELPTYFNRAYAEKFFKYLGEKLDRFIPLHADHVISISEEQTQYLLCKGVDEKKLTLISPAIYPESFIGGNGQIVRNKLGIGNDPMVIYTGGLQPYQNCKALVVVLRHLLQYIPSAHMVSVARSAPEDLRDYAVQSGVGDRFHFIQGKGLASERDCLAAADVAVIPRIRCIGFPIKILNYLAAKKPVVCFESIVKSFRSGDHLLAVPDGDYHAMAKGIADLITHSKDAFKLAQKGHQEVLNNYHWDKICPQIENIYDRLISAAGFPSGSERQ